MEDTNIEDVDSINNDTDQADNLEDAELEETDDVETLKQQKADLQKKQQSTYEQLKKAKGFERGEDGKWVKKTKPSTEKPDSVLVDEKKIYEVLEKRDLESLDLSDELKKEVSAYAKLKGVSVKVALNSEYIQFLKEKDDKKERIESASTGGSRTAPVKKNIGDIKLEEVDMRTPEGSKTFQEWEEHTKKELG